MPQFHCVVLSEQSCDLLKDPEGRASGERPVAAGHLRDSVDPSNEMSENDKRFTWSTSLAVCRMICLASFPSEWLKLNHLSCLTKNDYTPFMTSSTLSSTLATLLSTASTLSSIICVALRTSAVAIRASSCVNLSKLFSASSMSVLPISLFPNFSKHPSVNAEIFAPIYSLILPCLISLVAIPRMERTSTIIRMIVSIISVVGGTSV